MKLTDAQPRLIAAAMWLVILFVSVYVAVARTSFTAQAIRCSLPRLPMAIRTALGPGSFIPSGGRCYAPLGLEMGQGLLDPA